MDPSELIKVAPEIAKGAGALAAAIPLTPIIKAILGDAADELGQRFGDRVRLYRYGRSLDMLKKAEKMAKDAGFTPKAVPIKLLFPLLEGASFEEDEDLHSMWAALLANAASPENSENVRPGFITSLRQMAPDEAALLDWMVTQQEKSGYSLPLSLAEIAQAYNELGLGPVNVQTVLGPRPIAQNPQIKTFGTCFTSLVSNGFARRVDQAANSAYSHHTYHVTWRGGAFIEACRPPKPKS